MKIKGFNKDLCCDGIQFEVGKDYTIDPEDGCGVFIYSYSIQNIHEYTDYSAMPNAGNRFCEIENISEEFPISRVFKKVPTQSIPTSAVEIPVLRPVPSGKLFGCKVIRIIREITGAELDSLIGDINGNIGVFDTGFNNTGNYNTGNNNTGDFNTGESNRGDHNVGCGNIGDANTGWNNVGWYNTGWGNAGWYNTGGSNTGRCNTGYNNSGNYCTGMFNSCNNSTGIFCDIEPNVRVFNVDTGMKMDAFKETIYYKAITSSDFTLTRWVKYTDEEKAMDRAKDIMGGRLKFYTYKDACATWWNHMSDDNKEIIKSMPWFNYDIFHNITGIVY